MGKADFLRLGDWNVACFFCGRKRKASEMARYWKGFYVCPEHWEPRQPQDFVRGIPDNQAPPWTQPQADVFVGTFCTPNGTSCFPGWSLPGCAVPGYTAPGFDPNANQ